VELIQEIGGKIDPEKTRKIAAIDEKSVAATEKWRAKRSAAKNRAKAASKGEREREREKYLERVRLRSEGKSAAPASWSKADSSSPAPSPPHSHSPSPSPGGDKRTGTAGPFPTLTRRQIRERKAQLLALPSLSHPAVFIDTAGFDSLLSPTQLRSLAAQCYRVQATLVRTTRPLATTLAGIGEEFSEKYLSDDAPHWQVVTSPLPVQHLVPSPVDDLVYLSPEATTPLLSLSLSDTYVIGGIVDTNSMKGLSLSRGTSLGVRTVRLPLAECGVKVSNSLNVNHCYDVISYVALLQFGSTIEGGGVGGVGEGVGGDGGGEGRDACIARWKRAFDLVLPPRLAHDPFKVGKATRRGVGSSRSWVTPFAWFALGVLGARMLRQVSQ
jgi:hypothetical protein